MNVIDKSIDLLYHNDMVRYLTYLLIGLALYVLISSQYRISTQYFIGYGAILFMYVILQFKTIGPGLTLFTKLLAIVIVLRYLYWRTFYTLNFEGFFDFIGAMLLYWAEVFAIMIYLIGIFTSLSLLNRKPIDLAGYSEEEYPTVDVLIPSYNEPQKIIENTVLAALALDYPDDKYKVYLLDDGGTDQKCNDSDPFKAKLSQ